MRGALPVAPRNWFRSLGWKRRPFLERELDGAFLQLTSPAVVVTEEAVDFFEAAEWKEIAAEFGRFRGRRIEPCRVQALEFSIKGGPAGIDFLLE